MNPLEPTGGNHIRVKLGTHLRRHDVSWTTFSSGV